MESADGRRGRGEGAAVTTLVNRAVEVFDPLITKPSPCCGRTPKVTVFRHLPNDYGIECQVCGAVSSDWLIWETFKGPGR